MAFPVPPRLALPVSPYEKGGYVFRERLKRRFWLGATHLGEDIKATGGTAISAIGAGEILTAEIRAGSAGHKNWGGLVIIGHRHRQTNQNFYSIYGHLRNLSVRPGSLVAGGQLVGQVASELTPENGWWQIPHLHFAIYTGPWRGLPLPGFKRTENWRLRLSWWQPPREFIAQYNQSE